MKRSISIVTATVIWALSGSSTALASYGDTFVGSCVLTGSTDDASPEVGTYSGTCTGALNGKSRVYRVGTQTSGEGPSVGPVPVSRRGTGVTTFRRAHKASISFSFRTLLTSLTVEGDQCGGGNGTASPNSDGSVTLELDFSNGITG